MKTLHHKHINLLKRFFRQIQLPYYEHPSYYPAPPNLRFPGCWLDVSGLHFQQAIVSPGRLAHEAGHWALLRECDRARVRPGCLSDQGIRTCGEDMAAEAWSVAAATAAGVPIEELFTDLEDYQHGLNRIEAPPDEVFPLFYSLKFLQRKHVGVKLLERMGLASDYPEMRHWFATPEAERVQAELDELIKQREKQEAA